MAAKRDRARAGPYDGGRVAAGTAACRRRVLGGLAAGAAAAAAGVPAALAGTARAAGAPDRVVLQLSWDHQFEFAGYYAARWLGHYADAGLEVEIRPGLRPDGSALNAVEEVGSGRADFGVGGADILVGRDRGLPLVILAPIFQESPIALYALAGTRLDSLRDLMGLRVIRRPGDYGDLEMLAMLRAEGLDPDKLRSVPRTTGLDQLLRGEADVLPGYRISAPFFLRSRGVGFTELRPSSFGIKFYGDTLFSHAGLAEARPDLVDRFVAASLAGWRDALDRPDEVADRISRELVRARPTGDDRAFNLFQAKEVGALANVALAPLGHVNPERWRRMHDELARGGMVAGPFDGDAVIYHPEVRAARRQALHDRLLMGGGAALGGMLIAVGAWALSLRTGVRRATAAVRRNEDHYRTLVETSPDAIMVNRDGAIAFANPQLARLLGAGDVAEVIGRPVDEILDEESRPLVHAQAAAIAAEPAGPGLPPVPPLLKIRRLDNGTVVEAEPSAARVELDGRPAVQVALRDLSERRRAEREIEERNRALEAANRELEQFASVAAHDLRSPLRHISLLVGWLEEELGPQLSEQARGYMDQLRERAASVSTLIGGLRQYALAGSREYPSTVIDLVELIDGIVRLQDAPPGFRFEVDVVPRVIKAAEPPLAMVLRNLVANAVKHHDRTTGVVRVRARPCEEDESAAVRFTVEDDGPGIAPHLRERVFDMFQSFGPGLRPVGDGVGLALVRRTVTTRGGRIWLGTPGEASAAAPGPAAATAARGTAIHFTWPNEGGPPA